MWKDGFRPGILKKFSGFVFHACPSWAFILKFPRSIQRYIWSVLMILDISPKGDTLHGGIGMEIAINCVKTGAAAVPVDMEGHENPERTDMVGQKAAIVGGHVISTAAGAKPPIIPGENTQRKVIDGQRYVDSCTQNQPMKSQRTSAGLSTTSPVPPSPITPPKPPMPLPRPATTSTARTPSLPVPQPPTATAQAEAYEKLRVSPGFGRIVKETIEIPAQKMLAAGKSLDDVRRTVADDFQKKYGCPMPFESLDNYLRGVYVTLAAYSPDRKRKINAEVMAIWAEAGRRSIDASGFKTSCGFHSFLGQINSALYGGNKLSPGGNMVTDKRTLGEVQKMRECCTEGCESRLKAELQKENKQQAEINELQRQLTSMRASPTTFMLDTILIQYLNNRYGRNSITFSRDNGQGVFNDIQINSPGQDQPLFFSVENLSMRVGEYLDSLVEDDSKETGNRILQLRPTGTTTETMRSKTLREILVELMKLANTVCLIKQPGHFMSIQLL
jgi:hypothetical protein